METKWKDKWSEYCSDTLWNKGIGKHKCSYQDLGAKDGIGNYLEWNYNEQK